MLGCTACKLHGGALEGKTDLGQRAGSKPQSKEKVLFRSRAEEEGACCCCFEVWFGWRWFWLEEGLVVLLDGRSREASRLGTITVERGTGERSHLAAYA